MAISAEVLAERIEGIRTELAAHKVEIAALATRTSSLERAKGWVSGAIAAIGFLVGIFADDIKKAFGQ